tara:strand:- start:861 stop:1016 length:156 start_codon:yes stop_codon:yes gene_type:complete
MELAEPDIYSGNPAQQQYQCTASRMMISDGKEFYFNALRQRASNSVERHKT